MRFKVAGRERLLSFGAYPDVTLAMARDLRDAAQADLRRGVVPAGRRRSAAADTPPAEPAFEDVARAWHAQQKPRWKPHHAADVLAGLVADIFPRIGATPISAVTPRAVLDALRPIEARSPDLARRARQRISAVFAYAIADGSATADPAAPIVRALAPVVKRHRPAIIDLEPARAMLRAIEATPAHPVTRMAHRLLVLTAARPGEVRFAAWCEFEGLDGDAPLWRIPAARMKMKREHMVPLVPAVLAVLEALREVSGESALLFPSTRNARRAISENDLSYFVGRAGFRGRHVPHGWRSTFSSVMNERHRADRAVIDLMLAHAPSDETEAAYHRALHMDRRRELADEWARLILDGAAPASDLLGGARR
jgi:integrase